MRIIGTFKLKRSDELVLIADVSSQSALRSLAIQHSENLFQSANFEITKNTPVSFEIWKKDTQEVVKQGYKNFNVISIINSQRVLDQVKSSGAKSVYNTIKRKYNMAHDFPCFIYEVDQPLKQVMITGKRQSSKELAQISLDEACNKNDSKRLNAYIAEASEKAKSFPAIGSIAQDIPLVIGLIMSYVRGDYREVPVGTIVGLTGAIIYFATPIDVIPDVIPALGKIDDVAVLTWAFKHAHDDLQKYKSWLGRN